MKKKYIYHRIIAVTLILLGSILKLNSVNGYSDIILIIGIFLGLFLATKNKFKPSNKNKDSINKLIFSISVVFLISFVVAYLVLKN